MRSKNAFTTLAKSRGLNQADEGRTGSRYKLLGPGGPEGGPEPHYVAYVFCLFSGIGDLHWPVDHRLDPFSLGPTLRASERGGLWVFFTQNLQAPSWG